MIEISDILESLEAPRGSGKYRIIEGHMGLFHGDLYAPDRVQLGDSRMEHTPRNAAVARQSLTSSSRFAAKCGQLVASLELKKDVVVFAKREHFIKPSNIYLIIVNIVVIIL